MSFRTDLGISLEPRFHPYWSWICIKGLGTHRFIVCWCFFETFTVKVNRSPRVVARRVRLTAWQIVSAVQSLDQLGRGGGRGRRGWGGAWQKIQQRSSSSLFCERPWWAVLAQAGTSILRRCPSSIFLLTTTLPTLQGGLKDGFGETVVARDMLGPCEFLSLDSHQKSFLRVHKVVDLTPHSVFGLVLQVGDAKKFPQALGFKSLEILSPVNGESHIRVKCQSTN